MDGSFRTFEDKRRGRGRGRREGGRREVHRQPRVLGDADVLGANLIAFGKHFWEKDRGRDERGVRGGPGRGGEGMQGLERLNILP